MEGNHFCITAQDDLPVDSQRNSQRLEESTVKFLEFFVKRNTPNLVGDINELDEAYSKQYKIPGEYISSTDIQPSPNRRAEKAQSKQAEDIEKPKESTSTHEANNKENTG
ncbi:popeye domain-containing protein 3 [Grus japonensis]|uniref:Popeye domain-containing protein 3 n=1 Tax=Grus japonensis TaxID=30415 RepID=A0ABC9WLS4_GRUJA